MFNSATTEVLTLNGWRPIGGIDIATDKVATVDQDTTHIKFIHPKHLLHMENTEVYQIDPGLTTTTTQNIFYYTDGIGSIRRVNRLSDLMCEPTHITILNAGTLACPTGLDISSREMVFLLYMQSEAKRDFCHNAIIMEYDDENMDKEVYIVPVLEKLHYIYHIERKDGNNKLIISDEKALKLYDEYFDGETFLWNWINMNNTQACYFLYRITSHYHSSWERVYRSKYRNNLDLIQAIAVLNQKGARIVGDTVFTTEQFRTIDIIPNHMESYKCGIVNGLDVYGKHLLIRQNDFVSIVATN